MGRGHANLSPVFQRSGVKIPGVAGEQVRVGVLAVCTLSHLSNCMQLSDGAHMPQVHQRHWLCVAWIQLGHQRHRSCQVRYCDVFRKLAVQLLIGVTAPGNNDSTVGTLTVYSAPTSCVRHFVRLMETWTLPDASFSTKNVLFALQTRYHRGGCGTATRN
jgi:hypothetical protein